MTVDRGGEFLHLRVEDSSPSLDLVVVRAITELHGGSARRERGTLGRLALRVTAPTLGA